MISEKKQVYIVDDDQSVRRALGILLGTYGFAVTTYPCAEEFFSAVPNSAPGCLILDIHMPGINGWEAHRRLVKAGSKRPVIIVSAERNGALKEQAITSGAAGFFQKPIIDQELVDLINKVY